TLLGQLAASKQHDRFSKPVDWYSTYQTVLSTVGWVLQQFQFTKFQPSGASFTIAADVSTVLRPIVTNAQMQLFISGLSAVNKYSSDDERVVLFEAESHNPQNGTFQLALGEEVGGVATLHLLTLYYSSTQPVARSLSQVFAANQSDFEIATQTLT